MTWKGNFTFVLAIFCFVLAHPVLADSHGKFPGKGSLEAYDRSCKLNRTAVELANKKDYEKAIGIFRQAISIYPYDAGLYENLALTLRKKQNYQAAIVEYRNALGIESDYLSAWFGLANCYLQIHNLPEAEKCYRRAAELKPDSYEAVGTLGETLRDQGKFKEARIWLIRAKSCPGAKEFPGEMDAALKVCDEKERSAGSKEAAH